MSSDYFGQVSEAAAYLRSQLMAPAPRLGIVLGSGLGALAEAVNDAATVQYSDIPHFPQATVEGHS